MIYHSYENVIPRSVTDDYTEPWWTVASLSTASSPWVVSGDEIARLRAAS